MKKSLWATGLALFSMIFLNACFSTRVVSSWKSDGVTLREYNKVLIIGLMAAQERNLRENIENRLVEAFSKQGVSAGSAYTEYGPKAFDNLDEQAALERIKGSGYDGAFTIALLDKSKEKNYVPGSVSYRPFTYYNRFWGYFRTVYTRVYDPGYYTESTNYILEANFYDLNEGKLEYSAQTKSFDPGTDQVLAYELSEALLADMMKQGIVQQMEN